MCIERTIDFAPSIVLTHNNMQNTHSSIYLCIYIDNIYLIC